MSKQKQSSIARRIVAIAIVGSVLLIAACGQSRSASSTAAERLTLEVTAPSTRTAVTEASTVVTGIVSPNDATVRINGEAVTVGRDGAFQTEVELAYGSNRIQVVGEKEGLRSVTRTITLPRNLVLDVTSPVNNSTGNGNSVVVAGRVSDTDATVQVAGSDVELDDDGGFSLELPLHYVLTVIDVTAEREGVTSLTQLINVRQ